jgi:serine protease AprX
VAASAVVGSVLGVPGAVAASTPARTPTSPFSATQWASGDGNNVTDVAAAIGATSPAAAALTGKGVGIALIDTGVVPVPGLPAAQIVNGPDLSIDSQSPDLRYLDAFGHGTHLAGIMVGNDPAHGLKGIAPGAKLTSIKVGTSNGAADVSQVIAALDWLAQHRNDDPANPIRVINLSYGTDGLKDSASPLTAAAENAWKAGIVVVVSSGNQGNRGDMAGPAYDPFVVKAGAADTRGTLSLSDDTVSTFSQDDDEPGNGVTVVAPGQSIASLRNPSSAIDLNFPTARVGTNQFKGSGTSQAAAVVSGAVALLLQKQSKLTPDQVKGVLSATATGALHELNLASALSAKSSNVQKAKLSSGTGKVDGSRGSTRVMRDNTALSGESDVWGKFSSTSWSKVSATGTAWQGGTWMGRRLAGDGWTGTSWASKTWLSATWSGGPWGSTTWTDTAWSGRYWSNGSWDGRYWSGRYWSGDTWTTSTWS